MHSRERRLVENHPIDRRVQGKCPTGGQAAFEPSYLVGGQSVVLQPHHSSLGDRCAGLARNQKFLLGQGQLGAVDVEQWLTAPNGLPCRIDRKSLDPTLEPGGNDHQPTFVDSDRADGANRTRHGPPAGDLGSHAQHLHAFGTDGHGPGGAARGILVDRDVVHAHGVFFGHRRGIGKSHRMAVENNDPRSPGIC